VLGAYEMYGFVAQKPSGFHTILRQWLKGYQHCLRL
jgi:hypothetical protein